MISMTAMTYGQLGIRELWHVCKWACDDSAAFCFSFSWQLPDRVANPWDHSDPVNL